MRLNGGYTFSGRSVKVHSFIQSCERESVSCSVNLVFSELCLGHSFSQTNLTEQQTLHDLGSEPLNRQWLS